MQFDSVYASVQIDLHNDIEYYDIATQN